jgi:hypothetical protein
VNLNAWLVIKLSRPLFRPLFGPLSLVSSPVLVRAESELKSSN